jgi:predicted nuclease with TOPRIM domain
VADSALVEEVDYLSRQLDQVRDSVSSMRPELARQRYMLDQAERSYHGVLDEVDDLRSRVEWVEDPQSSAQRLATLEEGLRTLGQGMARLEGQLEVLLRFQQQPPVAQPLAAPAPPNPPAPGSGTA